MKYVKFLLNGVMNILFMASLQASEKNIELFNNNADGGNPGNISKNAEVALDIQEERDCFEKENNEIIKLPLAIQDVQQPHQQITRIIDTISQFKMIGTLNLSHNSLRSLSDALGDLPNLHTLQVKGNYLTVINEGIFKKLRKLQLLNLDDNNLGEIPAGGDENTIKIPASIIGPKLGKLRFTGNGLRITQIDPAVFDANGKETTPDNPSDLKEVRRIVPTKEELGGYNIKDTLKGSWGSMRKWTGF